jgi:TolB-like protein
MSLLEEIKRRKIFQVAAVYAVVSWLLVQIAVSIEAPLNLPDWVDTFVIVMLAIGFPITMVMSWAFNLTPEGLVRDQGDVAATAGGRRRGIQYVLAALLIVAVAWIAYGAFPHSRPLPNSIAVLPFESLGDDPDEVYFAKGMHDTLLNELANISSLNVIARTSMLQYEHTDKTIAEIARELNVQSVMEGTLQYADGQVRLTAQLINAATGAHLWSGNYDRPFADTFVIQSEMAERIAMALEAKLLPSERDRIRESYTDSPEAWLLYVKAMDAVDWDIRPNPSRQAAAAFHAYLDQALRLDPGFALAHAYESYDYSMSMWRTSKPGDPTEQEKRALAAAHLRMAVALDPDLGMVHGAQGVAAWSQWYQTSPEARAGFEKGLELSPGNQDIRDDLIRFHIQVGEYEAARGLADEGLTLDPNRAAYWLNLLGYVSLSSADLDSAVDYATQALELSGGTGPQAEGVLRTLASAAIANGDAAAALQNLSAYEMLLRDSDVISPGDFAAIAYGYWLSGDAEAARRLV